MKNNHMEKMERLKDLERKYSNPHAKGDLSKHLTVKQESKFIKWFSQMPKRFIAS